MKTAIWVIVIVVILGALGFGGWYFFLKKSPEGGACTSDTKCEQGLKCINKTCSSGKVGSVCTQKSDCTSGFCVNSTCTEGKVGNACATYKDCNKGLFCQKSVCSNPPDYSKYFDKVIISKMKVGMPPGPDNPLTQTTTFSKTDGIEIDFRGVKPETVGEYYVEFVDPTTGEVVNSTKFMQTKLEGRDTGMGTDLAMLSAGEYDLNVYFKGELIYSTQITIK